MNAGTESIIWTQTRQQALREQLQGFWEQDEWHLPQCPLAQGERGLRTLQFACTSSSINLELKYACWKKITSGAWSMKAGSITFVAVFVAWLNRVAPDAQSLLQRSLGQWEMSLRSYLIQQGGLQEHYSTYLDSALSPRQQYVTDPRIPAFRQIYCTLQEFYDERHEYDKEIWDLRKLGVSVNMAQPSYMLNFTVIAQPWLREAAKGYLRYSVSSASASSCKHRLTALAKFSSFLSEKNPMLQPAEVTRVLIVEYIGYLIKSTLTVETRAGYLHILRIFFDLNRREGWVLFPDVHLIYDEDMPVQRKRQPRFIPEDVLSQLHQHMGELEPSLLRMLLILEACGMRISELCTMSLNCLIQDTAGDWFLRYYQTKMKKEHSVPIPREIAAVIQEQQQAVQEQWGDSAKYLFPSKKGQPLKRSVFWNALNRLAYQKQIRDGSGQLYSFRPHRFRHTLATRMINNGVPQHIVQRYLGHETPQMTARYAYILDQTMKDEYAKYRGKVVDVTGKVIEQKSVADSSDLQWLKKNILAQALPNGKCALPVVAGDCPHANACLTCVHFRTDAGFLPQHKTQLAETQRLIQVARKNGWRRQAEMHEKVADNLQRIITSLEEPAHDA